MINEYIPVWGGRVPAMAAEKLRQIKGNGQKALAIVVYGNRDYDDALLVAVCPCNNDARKFSGIMYKTVKFGFEKMCSKRRDPELFV